MSAPVTVITGGGTGVGAALARLLTERGHKVVIAGRRKDPLDAVAADTGATVVVGDLSNEKGAKALIDAAVAAHGKISQALFDEARHFVHSEMWGNGVGVVCVPLQEAVFET